MSAQILLMEGFFEVNALIETEYGVPKRKKWTKKQKKNGVINVQKDEWYFQLTDNEGHTCI